MSSVRTPLVSPSLWACSATASATVVETSRIDETGGSRLCLGLFLAGDIAASALAAAMTI